MKKLKEITKRIATLGLAAALMINSLPATAFAAEIDDPDAAVVMEEGQQESGGEILKDESESDAAVSDEYTGSAAGEGNSDTAGSTAEGSEKPDDAVTPSTAAVSEDSRNEDKKQNSDAQDGETETDGDTAMVETDGFSLYTVEFTYDSKQYVLPGDSEVALSDILEAVGLSGEASAVEVSDTSLFSAEKNKDGEWIVTAHKAFGTKEWMKVIIDGVEYEITVTDGQEAGSWAELQAQFESAGTDENNPTLITLSGNVTAGEDDSVLVIPAGKYVTLDLSGNTIDRGLASKDPAENGSVIRVEGNLTLSDNSTGHTGKITGGNSTRNGGGVIVSGTFTMEGGTISGCSATFKGGGVCIDSHGEFTMTGGSISGCNAQYGGGVYVYGGEFTMTDGTISNCNAGWAGGGVYVEGSTFTMESGTIDQCEAQYGNGGVVYVCYGGTFTMENSTISGCNATSGGGVYVYRDGTFTMENSTISGCNATSGGGVYVNNDGTFNVSGKPVIKGNKTGENANNVELDSGKTITVTGALTDNAEIWVNAGKGVAFATKGDSYSITDTDLAKFHSDEDSSLVAAEDSDGSVKFFTPWGALQAKFNNASTVAGSPTQITLSGNVTAGEGDTALMIPAGKYVTLDLSGNTIDRGLSNVDAVVGGNVIMVEGNLTLSDNSTGHTGTLTGGNTRGAGGGVYVKGTFTMNVGTISGCNAVSTGGGVYVDEGSTFNMSGGTISGCNAGLTGGGVNVDSGTFTMSGGTISGCNAEWEGGGVNVDSGTFTMTGGTITNCGANRKGGGVCVYGSFTMNGGTFTMTGGTITDCNANSSGGGVYVAGDTDSRGTFTMEGGNISGCEATNGGGVYVNNDGTFNVSGKPVIKGNKTGENANNVELDSSKTITVTGALTEGAEIWVNAGKGVAFATKGDSYSITDTDLAKFRSDKDSSLVAAEDSNGVKFFTPWGALQAKFNNASTAAGSPTRITLTGDVTAGEGDTALMIPAGKYVTLDLSGNTIDRGLAGSTAIEGGNVITVKGNLTLDDSSDNENTPEYDGTGKLTGGNTTGNGGVSVEGGKFTMNGGNISGCNAGSTGGGVYVKGTFTMSGGTISDCSADDGGGVYVEGGTFTMSGGTITGCNADDSGGGVCVDIGGTFTMDGGTISGCSAPGSGAYGGGVCVSGGTFNMESGTITNCSAARNGGGVHVGDGDTFTMSGGTIKDCSAGDGGGVCVEGSTYDRGMFIMNGGTISGCGAVNGGGVYNFGTFNMNGGTISGCSADNGGGVCVYDSATFSISGAPVIRDNKKDGNANNVVLDGGKTITVTGELTTGAEIWVNADKGVAFATKGDSYSITDTGLAKFHSDADSSLVAAEDSNGVKFFTPWGALQAKFNNASTVAESPTQITLSGNVTASGNETALVIPEDRYVTLDLNGHTIDRGLAGQSVGNNDNVITVSGNLILTDNSSAQTGTITGGNNGQVFGGGVSINGGTFTMDGGTISGCNAARGGGVNVDSGTFTMTGGTITGCNAFDSGGGVNVDSGTFTMTGGTITDCNASSHGGRGGGVYVEGECKFTMDGGTISGCEAINGGGVYVNGSFTMRSGTISGCNVIGDESNGGGVYMENLGTFKVSGTPVISGNMKGSTSVNNVELGGKTISVNGALTSGAEIHVNAGLDVPIAEKGGDRTTALTETEAGFFKSDVDSNLLGGLNSDGQVVLKDPLPALTGASNLIYNGTEQTPALTFEGATLTVDKDYTVSYKKVAGGTESEISGAPKAAGDYKAVATGKGSYAGTSEAAFTIDRKEVTVSSGIAAKDKTYDRTTDAELITTNAVFTGICDGDSLTVSGTGTFESVSAGTEKNVTINQSSLTLGGTSVGDYVLASDGNQTQTTATIYKKKLTITGVTVADKEYDGNTTATTNTTDAAVTGLVDGESVVFTVVGTFEDNNKGPNKKVTLSDWTLTSGGDNYEIDEAESQQEATASITVTQVYIDGITAENRDYNGSTNATVTGTAVLKKVNDNEVVSGLTVSGITAAFADKKAGKGKTVTLTGGTLSDSTNYTLNLEETTNLKANIAPIPVTITGLSAENKTYDGTTAATVKGTPVINGKLSKDNVTVSSGSASFANATVGDNKQVTFSGYKLSGDDAGNYTLSTQPASVTAKITKATPNVTTAPTAGGITYGKTLAESTLSGGVAKVNGKAVAGTYTWADDTAKPTVADSNKTTYTVNFTPTDTTNLEATTCTVKVVVEQKEVGLDWSADTEFTFDGKSHAPTVTAAGFLTGDNVAVSVSGAKTNVGTGYTATAVLTGTKAGNYKLSTEGTTQEFSIKKAAAQTLTYVTADKYYNLTSLNASTAGVMPRNAGTLTYTKGTATKTGSVTVSSWSVDANGKITATINGGRRGDTITFPVIIGSANYEDSTVNVVLTLTDCPHENTELRDYVKETCSAKGYSGDTYCLDCEQTIETGHEIDMLDHTPAAEIRENEVAATCEEKGSYDEVVYCSVCGAEISRVKVETDPIKHDWGEWTETTPATEEAEGVETRVCKNDEKHTETRPIPKLDHVHRIVPVAEVAPTCTEDGTKAHYACEGCELLFEDEAGTIEITDESTLIIPKGHKGGVANCAHGAICEVCGEEYGEKDPTNHTGETEIKNAVEPTCTEEGYEGDTYCKGCGELLFKGEKLDPKGHDPLPAVRENVIPTSCKEEGSYEVVEYCKVCGKEASREKHVVDKLEHNWDAGKVTKQPTYDAPGVKTYTCSQCKETRVEEIPQLERTDLSTCTTSEIQAQTYTGKRLTPVINVKLNGKTLRKGVDYKLDYKNNLNAGTASILITGIEAYEGSKTVTFTIARKKLCTVTFSKTASRTYTGKAITPALKLTDCDTALKKNTDYTVKYTDNKNIGTATITYTGKGNYSGTVKKTFKILPKPSSVKKLVAGEKSLTATWGKVTTGKTTGYQLQYGTNKSFKSGTYKLATVKSNTTVKKTISKLTSGKTYYVRVRTYKTVDGKNIYSAWSDAKSVKVR